MLAKSCLLSPVRKHCLQHATTRVVCSTKQNDRRTLAAPLTVCRRLRHPSWAFVEVFPTTGLCWACVRGRMYANRAQRMQHCCATSNSPSVCNRVQQVPNIGLECAGARAKRTRVYGAAARAAGGGQRDAAARHGLRHRRRPQRLPGVTWRLASRVAHLCGKGGRGRVDAEATTSAQ